jgi:hypothetical protein
LNFLIKGKKMSESLPTSGVEMSLEEILQALDKEKSVESKMTLAISAMERALSSSAPPDFKTFWDVRKLCMEWMREPLAGPLRSQAWSQIAFLSQEARRIKKELEVESEFTKEQIEMAVQALQKEMAEMRAQEFHLADKVCEISEFNRHAKEYAMMQGALDQLNLWVERLTALRKELMDAELRMRSKNMFFEQLSKLGDEVFPKRKQLIKEISHLFEQDVHEYIDSRFLQKKLSRPPFQIKEEIKCLQQLAKDLTLNTSSFNLTRLKLSAAWDQLKAIEQDKKEHFAKLREVSTENYKKLLADFEPLKAEWEAKTASSAETSQKLAELLKKGRAIELAREEVQEWKKAVESLKNKISDEEEAKEEERRRKEQERALHKQQVMEEWRSKVNALVEKSGELPLKELLEANELLLGEIQESSLNKSEKLQLEKLFGPVAEEIRRKKALQLSQLPEDRLLALEQLQELFRQKQEEKLELEALSEKYRKLAGASGQDFIQALDMQEKIAVCMENKKEILQTLEEIQAKIDALSEEA